MNEAALLIVIAGYNLVLFTGTVYLVNECGWNAWWFLLTLFLMIGTRG